MRFGVEQKIKFSEFESERLIFRKFNEDDFSVLYTEMNGVTGFSTRFCTMSGKQYGGRLNAYKSSGI